MKQKEVDVATSAKFHKLLKCKKKKKRLKMTLWPLTAPGSHWYFYFLVYALHLYTNVSMVWNLTVCVFLLLLDYEDNP